MKQKEKFYVKTRTTVKGNTVTKEVPIDIFNIHDENGISLGLHLKNLQNQIIELKGIVKAEQDKRKEFVRTFKGAKK